MKYSVLLAALLAVSMTACSKKEESTTIVPAEAPAMEAPAPMDAPNVDVQINTPAEAPVDAAPATDAPVTPAQ